MGQPQKETAKRVVHEADRQAHQREVDAYRAGYEVADFLIKHHGVREFKVYVDEDGKVQSIVEVYE